MPQCSLSWGRGPCGRGMSAFDPSGHIFEKLRPNLRSEGRNSIIVWGRLDASKNVGEAAHESLTTTSVACPGAKALNYSSDLYRCIGNRNLCCRYGHQIRYCCSCFIRRGRINFSPDL